MADALQVELVAADRTVWSGEATMVIARTTEGDVGVLRGHQPMLSLLSQAVVEISEADGGIVIAVVDGGFLSVANDRVSVLSEHASLATELDRATVEAELEEARGGVSELGGEDAVARLRLAEARVRALEKAS